MKIVHYDDPDPRVVYDNPNLHWGYLLEEGDPGYVVLQPGQPGYVPPPSSPAPKPKRRRRSSTKNTTSSTMSLPFQYATRPTADSSSTTTQPVYRGTKTKAELLAEITARIGSTALTIELIIRTHHEVVIDWTTQDYKIEAFDGLIGFLCASGGATPVGAPEDWDFDSMKITLRGHWGAEGEDRARGIFSSEKVAEHSRSAPVWVEVYDSETKLPNHYVPVKGLTCRFANRKFLFDTAHGCKIRIRKSDNTYVDATGYPHIKGNTVVCTPPSPLTGAVHLEATCLINGTLRTSEYPFPLT